MLTADRSTRADLLATLQGLSSIDDPFVGATTPEAVARLSKLWPGDQWREIAHTATTIANGRRLEEYVFTPADGGRALPVVLMIDGNRGRLYSAHGLVAGRKPILPPDPSVKASAEPGDFLDGYFEHLVAADIEASIAMFEPDGYIQHSNGDRYQGPERLHEDYTNMFKANGGTIGVGLVNVMDDGERRAFEVVMPSGRPGVAVYERGPSGKIAAIRISL
jgi:hypothetical protein